jgi:hypothetical protein
MHRTVSARRLLRLAAAALAVAGLAVPATAAAAPGDPDTSLGSGRGFVTTDVVTNPNVHDAGTPSRSAPSARSSSPAPRSAAASRTPPRS